MRPNVFSCSAIASPSLKCVQAGRRFSDCMVVPNTHCMPLARIGISIQKAAMDTVVHCLHLPTALLLEMLNIRSPDGS